MTLAPTIPVSWGELLDKIAILTIKASRLSAPEARANVRHELDLLQRAARAAPQALPEHQAGLLAVNTRLWHIEDSIRRHEAAADFGPAFVALARAIYRENDERARIKRDINRRLGSPLVEEKQYTAYDRPYDRQHRREPPPRP
jgi:hypothetical protein